MKLVPAHFPLFNPFFPMMPWAREEGRGREADRNSNYGKGGGGGRIGGTVECTSIHA